LAAAGYAGAGWPGGLLLGAGLFDMMDIVNIIRRDHITRGVVVIIIVKRERRSQPRAILAAESKQIT